MNFGQARRLLAVHLRIELESIEFWTSPTEQILELGTSQLSNNPFYMVIINRDVKSTGEYGQPMIIRRCVNSDEQDLYEERVLLGAVGLSHLCCGVKFFAVESPIGQVNVIDQYGSVVYLEKASAYQVIPLGTEKYYLAMAISRTYKTSNKALLTIRHVVAVVEKQVDGTLVIKPQRDRKLYPLWLDKMRFLKDIIKSPLNMDLHKKVTFPDLYNAYWGKSYYCNDLSFQAVKIEGQWRELTKGMSITELPVEVQEEYNMFHNLVQM